MDNIMIKWLKGSTGRLNLIAIFFYILFYATKISVFVFIGGILMCWAYLKKKPEDKETNKKE